MIYEQAQRELSNYEWSISEPELKIVIKAIERPPGELYARSRTMSPSE